MSTTTISFFYLLLIFSFKCPYPAPFDQFNTVLSSLPQTTKLQAVENSNVRRDRNNDKSVPCLKFLVFLNLLFGKNFFFSHNYLHSFISAFTSSQSQVPNLSRLASILFIPFSAMHLLFSFR